MGHATGERDLAVQPMHMETIMVLSSGMDDWASLGSSAGDGHIRAGGLQQCGGKSEGKVSSRSCLDAPPGLPE
jgi:hypothetical protein